MKFTIRDLLWLTIVVAIGMVAWRNFAARRELILQNQALEFHVKVLQVQNADLKIESQKLEIVHLSGSVAERPVGEAAEGQTENASPDALPPGGRKVETP